jgi:hypothetical protein
VVLSSNNYGHLGEILSARFCALGSTIPRQVPSSSWDLPGTRGLIRILARQCSLGERSRGRSKLYRSKNFRVGYWLDSFMWIFQLPVSVRLSRSNLSNISQNECPTGRGTPPRGSHPGRGHTDQLDVTPQRAAADLAGLWLRRLPPAGPSATDHPRPGGGIHTDDGHCHASRGFRGCMQRVVEQRL